MSWSQSGWGANSWGQTGWESGSGGSWDSIGSSAIYGVSWNEGNSSPVLTRLGSTAGFAASASPGNNNLPVHRLMRRCVMRDDGGIVYYLDQNNSLVKQGGGASVLDGTDGQVMVEIPLFWYKYSYSGTTHSWWISLNKFSGAERHPAFYKDGSWVANRYIGAYEAWTDGSTKLASVSGQLSTVSQTIGTFRTRAEARGTGWHQMDWYLYNAVVLLYLTEYADLNAQATLGAGVTDYDAWLDGPQALTGNSNSIGNAIGNLTLAVDRWNASTAYTLNNECTPDASQNGYTYRVTVAGTSGGGEPTWPTTLGNTVVDGAVTWECVRHAGYNSYRGVENWFGHIWKFIDGVNIHNSSANGSRLYTAQDYTAFASDTDTGYLLITSDLAQLDGFGKTLVPTAHGFAPKTVGGSSSTYVSDYHYTYYDNNPDSGWRVLFVGGGENFGSNAGPFYLDSNLESSNATTYVGSRLAY